MSVGSLGLIAVKTVDETRLSRDRRQVISVGTPHDRVNIDSVVNSFSLMAPGISVDLRLRQLHRRALTNGSRSNRQVSL